MIETAAGWIAPAAMMIAAIMTAANLGSRVTGWGFVVFTVGAIGWIVTALATGQKNLLISNGFLLLIDIVGAWRWLGRQARYDEGARAAAEESAAPQHPTLFPVTTLAGKPILDGRGATIATAVDAMVSCEDGSIAYLVVSTGGVGGVGERLHALGWSDVRQSDDGLASTLDAESLGARAELVPDCWPTSAEAAGVR